MTKLPPLVGGLLFGTQYNEEKVLLHTSKKCHCSNNAYNAIFNQTEKTIINMLQYFTEIHCYNDSNITNPVQQAIYVFLPILKPTIT